jgi:hypothetical protein
MPNWCDTIYKCVGDPKEVRSLYKIINANDKRKTSRVKNGFGTLWIGNIIDALGEDWEKLRCRGEIIGYHIENNLLTIYQSTAWCEQEGFRECIEKKFPSIQVYYREEEPGCDVYYTNDADRNYFPERYLLNNNDELLYFNTIEEAAEYVSGIVNQKVEANMEAIEKALDNYEEEHEDDDVYFSFHEFQVVDD